MDFERDEHGRYQTSHLNEKQFQQVFRLIQNHQNKNRRGARRTLQASVLAKKTPKDIAKLGEKSKGVPFTKDDLIAFEQTRKSHKLKFDSKTAGITYAQLVSGSRDIDIKRANNRVHDGSGITRAHLSGINGDTLLIRVKASSRSVHQDHMVKIRLDEYYDLLEDPPAGGYLNAAKQCCKGRISIACDCGRHQYWYRYLATVGNYCVAPPKEFAFPKIRNPELKGVACKHVLKGAVMLQSPTWQKIIANQMERSAKRSAFGDDRKYNHVLTDAELTDSKRNRSTKINKDKISAEYKRYQRNLNAFEKKLKVDSKQIEQIRNQAKRIRKQNEKIKKRDQQISVMRDMLKSSFSLLADQYSIQGRTREQAITDFANRMNMTTAQIRKAIK